MRFDIDIYRKNGIAFPKTFHSIYSIDKSKYSHIEEDYQKNGGLTVDQTFDKLEMRTTASYFSKVLAAQTDALSYSDYVFPTYKFLMSDALLDDWMAIIDPHSKWPKRDHSVHQPMTAYIVSQLLGCGDVSQGLKVNNRSLLDLCSDILINDDNTQYLRDYFKSLYPLWNKITWTGAIKKKFAIDIFYQAAVVSALFHDIGYPWQFANNISKYLKVADYDCNNFKTRSIDIMLNAISNRLLAFPFHGYSVESMLHPTDNWNNRLQDSLSKAFYGTHGFPGALAFTHLTDEVRKFPQKLNLNDAIYQFIIDWAAVGILMHDMPGQYAEKGIVKSPQYKLHVDTDPLSCLIAMSDILEEYNRPNSAFTGGEDVKITYDSPCKAVEVDVVGDVLNIAYLYEDNIHRARNQMRREEEIDEYFNEKTGFIDLTGIGINHVKCHTDIVKTTGVSAEGNNERG